MESVCWGNSTVGSNPTLSAIIFHLLFSGSYNRGSRLVSVASSQPSPCVYQLLFYSFRIEIDAVRSFWLSLRHPMKKMLFDSSVAFVSPESRRSANRGHYTIFRKEQAVTVFVTSQTKSRPLDSVLASFPALSPGVKPAGIVMSLPKTIWLC